MYILNILARVWNRFVNGAHIVFYIASMFFTRYTVSIDIRVPLIALPFSKKYQPNTWGARNMSLNLFHLFLTCASTRPVVQCYWITDMSVYAALLAHVKWQPSKKSPQLGEVKKNNTQLRRTIFSASSFMVSFHCSY